MQISASSSSPSSCLKVENSAPPPHIPTVALGRHATGDAMGLQKLAVSGGSVLAALIGVDQQLVTFNLGLTQGPIEGLHQQRHLYGCAQAPADDAANEPIHPHRQVAPPDVVRM